MIPSQASHSRPYARIGVRSGSLALAFAMGLAGCSVSSPLTVQSTASETAAKPSAVALIALADGEAEQRTTFRSALGEVFASRGVPADGQARLVADFAISSGSAEHGVQPAPDRDEAIPDPPAWIDAPRISRRFDRCSAQELRGTLVLIDRGSGEIVYRGRGMATECGFDDAAVRSLAEVLVDDFLARF